VEAVAAREPARMSPLSRYANVFFSPGAVFDDIRRDPRGWWVPILIGVVLTILMVTAYTWRFSEFQGEIAASQIKNNTMLKLLPVETLDKMAQATLKSTESIPVWQLVAQQAIYIPFGVVLVVWFFTFLYSVVGLAMGWLGNTRASKVFIPFAIVLGILVVFVIGIAVINVVGRQGTRENPMPPAPWTVAPSAVLCLAALIGLVWMLSWMSREVPLGRILGGVSYAIAPGAIGAVLSLIIIFLKVPDATPLGELTPSNLGALVGSSGALGALASSLDLFTLWVLMLVTIALSKVLKIGAGAAAIVVFTPWIAWVFCKVLFGAIGSMNS